MAVVEIIEQVTLWIQNEVCSKVKLKLPDDDRVNKSYNGAYKLVHPTAFSLFAPSKDRLPPNVLAPNPGIYIQMLQGSDDLIHSQGSMQLRLCFAAWDPGLHGPDIFMPEADPLSQTGIAYKRWDADEAKSYFERRSEGWRDVFNFVDTALRIIENAEYIADYRVMKEDGIRYGLFEEDGAIPDYYPYWYAWVMFPIQYGILRKSSYQDLL